jgi:3-hydroxyisobutyrate dehydrogenase-like beta-hydroxyacid dehydrogenase
VKKSSKPVGVGLIGIGLLGFAFAHRALQAGFSVAGYDRDALRRQRLKRIGGQSLDSAREVALTQRRIFLALPDSGVTRQVISEMEPALSRGTIILDGTTGDPQEMAALGRHLTRRGVHYLDTTILGSSADVRAGRAVVMAGGNRAAFASSRDLLSCFAQKQFHLGPSGSGARMKLVVNLVLGLNRAALAEGLAFARAAGVSPVRALEVLQAGLAYSRVMDAKGPKMLRRDFKPAARLAQHLKDVRLILRTARQRGLAVPLTAQHQKLLSKVAAAGGGHLDNSAVILAYD